MSIKKTWLAAVGALVLMTGATVFADLEVKPYGAAQYRLRERIHSQTGGNPEVSGTTMDYHNLFSWRSGVRAKVDDQLSLQFQIGNDWGAGEGVTWANNNMPGARLGYNNLYVHIASFKWNPGPVVVEGGVIPLNSSGTLDLLERSLNLGHYGEAAFQGWSTEMNNSMLGLKVGVPILKDDLKLGVELFQTIIDQRNQPMSADNAPSEDIRAYPTAPLFVLTIPVDVTTLGLKLTPEVSIVMNRNYNDTLETGDMEIIAGLGGSFKLNDGISFSLISGYGMVSNENSQAGTYGANGRVAHAVKADPFPTLYNASGLLVGIGASVKAGPGTIQFDFKYNSTENSENVDGTHYDYTYVDLRYAYKAHDKLTITPRYRNYYRAYPTNHDNVSRMENRLELILEGSF